MTRGRQEDDVQRKFSPTSPHFFKIILEETLRDNKLQIPYKFVRIYGDTLSDSVCLKLPCGLRWEVGLTKCDGKAWIDNGWTRFQRYYSLGHGDLLVFRYEGNSRFHVLIFDKSTMEIDYPSNRNRFEKHDPDRQPHKLVKEETEEADSVESLESFPACPKAREKSRLPSPRPRKRLRTNPVGKTPSNQSHPRPKVHKDATSKVWPRGSLSNKAEAVTTMNKKTEVSAPGNCLKPLTVNKKARAHERAKSFQSENPSFTVSLGASYATAKSHFHLPFNFAETYIKKIEGEATLKVSDGRCWSVLYKVRDRLNGSPAPEFCHGWIAFVRDNNLEEGDVCTFELTNGNDISFNVSIVKANVSLPQSKLSGDRVIPRHSCSSASRTPKAASQFFSTNPYFQVTLRPCHLEKHFLNLPSAFTRSYFKGKAQTVILQVGRGSWPVKLLCYGSDHKLCGGWGSFAKENSLRPGDVCIFELIDRNPVVLKVSMFGQNR